MGRERIVCACGGQLSRPLPPVCPHCGAVITGVRRRAVPAVAGLLLVLAMFGLLLLFAWWMLA